MTVLYADEEGIETHDQEAPSASVSKALSFPNTTVVLIMAELDHGLGLLMGRYMKRICSAMKLVGVYFPPSDFVR